MTTKHIHYDEQTASPKAIETHLIACDEQFLPRLSRRVNLKDYSSKLFKQAKIFEAWYGEELAGLIAVYFPERMGNSGFISNVSVLKQFSRQDIASTLMQRCIDRAREMDLSELRLEVTLTNAPAIQLYRKFEFAECGSTATHLTMRRNLAGTTDHEQ